LFCVADCRNSCVGNSGKTNQGRALTLKIDRVEGISDERRPQRGNNGDRQTIMRQTSLARPPSRKIADRAPSTCCDEASWISDGFDGGWSFPPMPTRALQGERAIAPTPKSLQSRRRLALGRDVPSIVCATRGPWPLTVAESSFIGMRELVLSVAGI
ncbi:hypothetical protein HN011_006418, partial [Eciton burchellii]